VTVVLAVTATESGRWAGNVMRGGEL
jgi:hypothetical protein